MLFLVVGGDKLEEDILELVRGQAFNGQENASIIQLRA